LILQAVAQSSTARESGSASRLLQLSVNGSCPVPQEILFLVDSSASIGQAEFNKSRAFVVDILQKLVLPPIRSGVIRFEDQYDIVATLSFDKANLIKAVQSMGYAEGETLLGPPLMAAHNLLLTMGSFEHQTIVVITDGDPSDWTETRTQADAIRESGIRLMIVKIGTQKSGLVQDIVSTPVKDNIITVDTYDLLLSSADALIDALDVPCPCDAGTSVPIVIENTNYRDTLKEVLPHGQSRFWQCRNLAVGYSGSINVTCNDAQVLTAHTCEQTCRADNTEALVIFDDKRVLLQPPTEILSQSVGEVACKSTFPGSLGTIQLFCENGTLVAQHGCVRRCPAGLNVSVTYGSSVVELQAPEGGLDGGTLLLRQCENHFGGTTGSIGLGCFDGQLQASAQCEEQIVCPPAGSESDGVPLPIVIVACLLSAIFTGAFGYVALGKNQPTGGGGSVHPVPFDPEKIPEKILVDAGAETDAEKKDFEMQVEEMPSLLPIIDPPPPKKGHDASTQVLHSGGTHSAMQTDPKLTQVISTQTDAVMYAELARGTQLPLDVVFVVDSSASVGRDDFQKATQFLLEVIHHFDMPIVRTGFIQFNDKIPFPDSAGVTHDRDQIEAKIKAMEYDIGETKMEPPLRAAGEMLEKVGSLSQKLIVVLTDGDPNDIDAVRDAVKVLKARGIRLMFVHIGTASTPSIMRELATEPAERNVIHLESYTKLVECASFVLKQVLEVSKWVRRVKCTMPVLGYQTVPNIDAIDGTEIMHSGWAFTECKDQAHWCWCWDPDKNSIIVDPQVEPWDTCDIRPALPPPKLQPKPAPKPEPQPPKPAPKVATRDHVTQTDPMPAPNPEPQPPKPGPKPAPKVIRDRDMQTEIRAIRDRDMQTDPMPVPRPEPKPEPKPVKPVPVVKPKGCDAATQYEIVKGRNIESIQQTESILYAELMCGPQLPLDVVFVVDSSASVGEQDFHKATKFLMEVIQHFEMPAVCTGFIQFNDTVPFPDEAQVTGNRAQIEAKIKAMKYVVGETKMAPPLVAAAGMLRDAQKMNRSSQKLIIVLTDGDPNDLDAVRKVTSKIKDEGIRLVFVHVGDLATPEIMNELATVPTARNVIHLNSYDELLSAASFILGQVLEVSQWVRRMKFASSLKPYQVVKDIDAVAGYEIMCPGWDFHNCVYEKRLCWSWNSENPNPIVDQHVEPWSIRPLPSIDDVPIEIIKPELKRKFVEAQVQTPPMKLTKPKCAEVQLQTVSPVLAETGMNTALQKAKILAEVGMQTIQEGTAEAGMQTNPIVRAILEPGRHVPMDVVFCVDSSASVCFVKQEMERGTKFVETGNIGLAKAFIQSIVHHCDMPEAFFGLIRFEDNSVVISEMTGERPEFNKRLNDMTSSLGETKMAAPLQQARSLMQSTGRAVKKTLLMITDGDPNDPQETSIAAEGLKAIGVQLLVVKIGHRGDANFLSTVLCNQSKSEPGNVEVIEVAGYEDLGQLLPEILRRVVEATRWVHRAKANLTLPPYEVVSELGSEGFELDLKGQRILDEGVVPWDPSHQRVTDPKPKSTDDELVMPPNDDKCQRNEEEAKHWRKAKLAVDEELAQLRLQMIEIQRVNGSDEKWRKAKLAQDQELSELRMKYAELQRVGANEEQWRRANWEQDQELARLRARLHELENTSASEAQWRRMKLAQDEELARLQARLKEFQNGSGSDAERLRKDLRHAESRIEYLTGCLAHLSEPVGPPSPAPPPPVSPAPVPTPIQPAPLLSHDDPLKGFRQFIARQFRDVEAAFHVIDDNRSGRITLTELIKGLQPLGFDKHMAQDVYNAIVPQHHRHRGYMSKQDWLNALSHKSDLADVVLSGGQTPKGAGPMTMFGPEASDAPTLARVNVAPILQTLPLQAPELVVSVDDVLSQFREIVLRRFDTVNMGFQKIDRNGSGQITIAELIRAFSSEPGFDREMGNAVFREMIPQSGNPAQSTVSREDWSRALRKRSQTPRGSAGSPERGSLPRNSSADVLLGIRVLLVERYGDLKKSFEAFDNNKSGQLSSIEFTAGLNRLGVDRATAQKVFKELSQGKTNALTQTEWMLGFERSHPRSSVIT
jgi:Mg-chelatase subunit ChlD/Ca2+-binding EF-hand superfamily protein